jgi:hypothetical protein
MLEVLFLRNVVLHPLLTAAYCSYGDRTLGSHRIPKKPSISV